MGREGEGGLRKDETRAGTLLLLLLVEQMLPMVTSMVTSIIIPSLSQLLTVLHWPNMETTSQLHLTGNLASRLAFFL